MKMLRWVILVVIVILIIAGGGLAALLYGQARYQQAHLAYSAGECKMALPLYRQVASYPAFMGSFVAKAAAEQAECLAFEVAISVAASSEPEGAIANYAAFRENYPASALSPVAMARIESTYLDWGRSLRTAGSYPEALQVYEEMAYTYTHMTTTSEEACQEAYLEWGAALSDAGNFAAAIEVFDAMTAESSQFAEAAAAPSGQAHLDWAGQLASNGLYADAERIYRQLLQREQDRQLPVSQVSLDWPVVNTYPYAIAEVNLDQATLRTGPGESFEVYAPSSNQASRHLFGVLGTSLDGSWLALSLGQQIDPDAAASGDLRELPWNAGLNPVAWAPASSVSLLMTFADRLPVPGILLFQVSEASAVAATAVAGLESIYTAWAEDAQLAGDIDTAMGLFTSLPELTLDAGVQNEIFQQLAETCLHTAEDLNIQGDYAQSLRYTLYAEDYDRFGGALTAARTVRIDDWMQLGALAATQGDWEGASSSYMQVLDYEAALASQGEGLPVWQGPQAAENLAAVYRDWGVQRYNAGSVIPAIETLRKGLDYANPAFAQEINNILSGILNDTGQAVQAGGGCSQVAVLDLLAADPALQPKAFQHLPRALYQCGQEALGGAAGLTIDDAEAAFNRILTAFPNSEYAARAQRSHQYITWARTVKRTGVENAASEVCGAAGSTILANLSTLEKPYRVYFSGQNLNSRLPDHLKTPSGGAPSAIVCLSEEAVKIQTCPYKEGHTLFRYRYKMKLRIVDPLNNKTVMTGDLNGSTPQTCAYREYFTGPTKSYYGDEVSPQAVLDWLNRYIK